MYHPHVSLTYHPHVSLTYHPHVSLRYNSLVLTGGSHVVCKGFRTCIMAEDMRRLATGSRLNSDLVNFYMKLLVLKFSCEVNKIYCFDTWFATKLFQNPDLAGFRNTTSSKWNKFFRSCNYNGVQRWTVKVDLFRYQIILIPVFVDSEDPDGRHFQMCVVHIGRTLKKTRRRGPRPPEYNYKITLSHCCSLGWPFKAREKIKTYFRLEHYRQHGSWLGEIFSVAKPKVPQQSNSVDCGVHACANAYTACLGFPLDDRIPIHNLEGCNEFRKHMALSIVETQIQERFEYPADRMTLP